MSIFDYIAKDKELSTDAAVMKNRAERAKAFTDWQENQAKLGLEVDPLELKRAATAIAGGDPILGAMLPLGEVAKKYTEGVNRISTNNRLAEYNTMAETENKIREAAWENYDLEKTPEENANVFAPGAPPDQLKEMSRVFHTGLPKIVENKTKYIKDKFSQDTYFNQAKDSTEYERAIGRKLTTMEKTIADQLFTVRNFNNNQAAKVARDAIPGQTPTQNAANVADTWGSVPGSQASTVFSGAQSSIVETGINNALAELDANQIYRTLLVDGKTDQAAEMARQAFLKAGVSEQMARPDVQGRLRTVNEGAVLASPTKDIAESTALAQAYLKETREAADTAIATTAFTKMFEGSAVYKGISNSTGLRLQIVDAFRNELITQGRDTHEYLLSSTANKAMLASFISQNLSASVIADGSVNTKVVSDLVAKFLANPAVANDIAIGNNINSRVGAALKKIPYQYNPMDAISQDATEQRAATQKVIDYVSGPVTSEEDANNKAKILDTFYAKRKSVIEQHKAYLNKLKYDPSAKGLLAKGLLDKEQQYDTRAYEAEIRKLEEELSMITEARNKIGTNITKDGAAPQYRTPENTKAATPDIAPTPPRGGTSFPPGYDPFNPGMSPDQRQSFPGEAAPQPAPAQPNPYPPQPTPDKSGRVDQPLERGGFGNNTLAGGSGNDTLSGATGMARNTGYQNLQNAAYSPNNEQLSPRQEQTRDHAVDYDVAYGDVSPMETYLNALSEIESSHGKFLQASTSSASGRFQFIDSTWKTIAQKYGPTFGFTEADRGDPRAEAMAAAALTMESVQIMSNKLGRQVSMGETYMAHFLGPSRAVKMIRHLGTGQLAAHLFPAAAKANKNIFYNKQGEPLTVDQVYAKLNTKVERAINNGDEGVKIFDFTEGGELKDGANLGRDA